MMHSLPWSPENLVLFVAYVLAFPVGIGIVAERLPFARALFQRGERRAFWKYWATVLGTMWVTALAVLLWSSSTPSSLGLPVITPSLIVVASVVVASSIV